MNLLETIKYGISNSYIINTVDLSYGIKEVFNFAKQLNCESDIFCNNCSICSKIDRMEHPDIISIPNEEEFISTNTIKIDDLRLLQKEAMLRPVIAKHRIIIINYADRMTEQAQNSLLKILEESPNRTILFLITDNIFGLLTTIRSRCRQINYSFKKEYNINFLKYAKDLETSSNDLSSFFNKCREISSKDKISLLEFIDFAIILMRDILSYSLNGKLLSNDIEDYIKNFKVDNIIEKIDKLNNYRYLIKNRSINKDIAATVVMSIVLGYL
jgi:DNA polymerase III delta prime subunit